MSRKPVLNALSASLYILLVASVLNFVSKNMAGKPDTFFAPVAFLSLFTLSVAVMAFLFFYQPVLLFIDGKKKQAVNLFVQTLGIFAAITAVVLTLVFTGWI